MPNDTLKDIVNFFENEYRHMYLFCSRYSRLQKCDIEDVIQNVFIKVYKNHDKYNGSSSLKTWIFAIAKNEMIDFVRKRNSYGSIFEHASNISLSIIDHTDNLNPKYFYINEINRRKTEHDDQLKFEERKHIVDDILKIFNSRDRSVFQMRLDGCDYKHISKVVGITQVSARAIAVRRKNEIRKIVK